MKYPIFLLLLSIGLLFQSCRKPEPMKLRRLENTEVGGGQLLGKFKISTRLILYNPNSYKIKLKSYEIEVYLNDKLMTTMEDEQEVLFPAESESPLDLEASLSFLDVIGNLKNDNILSLKGKIRVVHRGLPLTIPVDHDEKIKL